jgi:uncharacterized membrane protein YgdD (TMEM256/DUF423 family)
MTAGGDGAARSAVRFQALAALLLAIATVVGAFGAHALKTRLPVDRYEVLQTAVHYQFFHALGLLVVGLLLERAGTRGLHYAARLLLIGILLFSGSLYLLIAGAPRLLGAVTPVGGLCLIGGWLLAAWALYRRGPRS